MTDWYIINPPLTQITDQCLPCHHLFPNTNPNPNLSFSLFHTNPLAVVTLRSRHTLQPPPPTPAVIASPSTGLLRANHHLLAQSRRIANLRQPPLPREPPSSRTISPARQPPTTTVLALAPSRPRQKPRHRCCTSGPRLHHLLRAFHSHHHDGIALAGAANCIHEHEATTPSSSSRHHKKRRLHYCRRSSRM